MRILGIDPGSYKTGYGLIHRLQSEDALITSGTWAVPAKASFLVRAKYLQQQLQMLLEQNSPDVFVLESSFSGLFPKSGLQLAQMRGVFLAEALRHSIEIVEYSPRKVKQMVTGFGAAEKVQVNFMVQHSLRLARKLEADEADALALCLTYSRSQKPLSHDQKIFKVSSEIGVD